MREYQYTMSPNQKEHISVNNNSGRRFNLSLAGWQLLLFDPPTHPPTWQQIINCVCLWSIAWLKKYTIVCCKTSDVQESKVGTDFKTSGKSSRVSQICICSKRTLGTSLTADAADARKKILKTTFFQNHLMLVNDGDDDDDNGDSHDWGWW